jgi:serine/threonine-protein kinase
VHRDVKPENLFLVERGGKDFVKVVDFGISKTMRPGGLPSEESLRLTDTGLVLGTPLYMSPEQARGEDDLDHRIDIYALGVILYECLTGEVPFRASNYLGVIAQVVANEPTAPRQLRPELRISEAMERVVQKAMAKSRADRYASMEALEADLERVAAGDQVEAPRPSLSLPQRSRGNGLLLAAMGVLAGTALLLAIDRFSHAPVTTPPVAAPPATIITPPPPAPRTVVLHVETTPPGAEVRQGSRVFGPAPRDVLLPRSEVPAQLSFHLDGYEDGLAQIVPTTDDSVRIKLAPKPRGKHVTKAAPPPAPTKPATPPATPSQSAGETLPNPY